jgi:radical SAM protein with 4Fe4S-binding SPASM domain
MKHLIQLYAASFELTLACPCNCETCGSSAGKRREKELRVDEWKEAAASLARLGCKRLSLLGGEPLLYNGWEEVARFSKAQGLLVEMITSGVGLDRAAAERMFEAGLTSVTVSVDGTEAVHNGQRGISDGYRQALEAIAYLDEAGLRVGVNTQVNLRTLPTLEALAPKLQDAGAMGWQLQLTMPSGRAADADALILPPEAMPAAMQTIRRLVSRKGLRPFITDNIGYLTKDDPLLRTPPGVFGRCWLGCFAGLRAVGITSDGAVKGCLSLPDEMIEGRLSDTSLEEIWRSPSSFAYNRSFSTANLGGACADCDFGAICRGGCTAFALFVHGKANVSTHCLRLHN